GSAAPARRHCAAATSEWRRYRSCRKPLACRPAKSRALAPARRGRATAPARTLMTAAVRQGEERAPASAENVSNFGRLHAVRADFLAHRGITQQREERLHRRTLAAILDQQKIVLLGRDRNEGQAVKLGHRGDRDAPIRPSLRNRCG